MKTILYKRDSKNKIRQWMISVVQQTGTVFGIETTDGIVGGKLKAPVFKEAVPNNQFKNSEAKAEAMYEAAIVKKLRSNYFETIADIKDEDVLFMPTGCPGGMIWEEFKGKSHVKYPALASPKLDGSKLYSTWRENRVFLNTRSAKEHKNFRHIEEALKSFYDKNPNIVLDGEAYNHEYADRFEELQSIFRKESPTEEQRAISKDIAKFYIYDAVDLNNPDMTATERQVLLMTIFHKHLKGIDCLVEWHSKLVYSEEDYDSFHEKCMDEGFEGTVLKISSAPYVQRKNKFVMKRKPKFDCEFEVVDILEGTGTAKGIASAVKIDLNTGTGINEAHDLLLSATDFQDAGMASGWNHAMLKEMLENREDYVGNMATIEYGGITSYGKLRFPKFKGLRTD